jgi:hypothetical protein
MLSSPFTADQQVVAVDGEILVTNTVGCQTGQPGSEHDLLVGCGVRNLTVALSKPWAALLVMLSPTDVVGHVHHHRRRSPASVPPASSRRFAARRTVG